MIGFPGNIRRDFRRIQYGPRESWIWLVYYVLVDSGFRAVFLNRLANFFLKLGVPVVPALITSISVMLTGAEILPSASIRGGLVSKHPVAVVIGHGACIGENCTILQSVTVCESLSFGTSGRYPTIGNGCLLSAGCVIVGDIEIGHESIVGANAVVLSNMPARSLVVGAPATAKPLKHFFVG